MAGLISKRKEIFEKYYFYDEWYSDIKLLEKLKPLVLDSKVFSDSTQYGHKFLKLSIVCKKNENIPNIMFDITDSSNNIFLGIDRLFPKQSINFKMCFKVSESAVIGYEFLKDYFYLEIRNIPYPPNNKLKIF